MKESNGLMFNEGIERRGNLVVCGTWYIHVKYVIQNTVLTRVTVTVTTSY